MKKLAVLIVAAVVLASLTTSYAQCGGGACAAGATAKACPSGACDAALSKLKLTDEQQNKLAALKEECSKVGCSEESKAKFCAGLKEILTPKQLDQFKAAAKKAGVDCPLVSGGCCKAKS